MSADNSKIKEDKERLEGLIRSMAEGLIVVDKNGKVLAVNPAAELILGSTLKEKLGINILEGLKEEHVISLVSQKEKKIEVEIMAKDPEVNAIIRASSAIIEDEEGNVQGMISVLNDITKQKELSRVKEAFISNVSHDLRAPLISIQKSLEMALEDMEKGDLNPQTKRFVEIAGKNAERLTILMKDLLDINKLESAGIDIKYQRIKIRSMINDVFDMFKVWAESKAIELSCDGLEDIEVEADEALMTQVFTNLVGNALKFTGQNGRVNVSSESDSERIKIVVKDTGCGIAPGSLEKIFEKFEQVESTRKHCAVPGTGLGLSIVRDIVKLHKGKVDVESSLGRGSSFYVEIPIVNS
ncbi:MAG: ATP-binding protein [Candidatus Omnitrophota bacterium]